MNDKIRKILASNNITFACFKMVLSALLTKADIDEDSFVDFYEDYSEGLEKYNMSIEEWAEFHFKEFNLEDHSYELRSKQRDWIPAFPPPPENVSYLVFIPEEDNHITAGMWDVSQKWILLDEYREPKGKVTHIMKMPENPK